ncbi:MAG: DnaJ domain-containing protein [Cyanobacteriota bacterium]
MPTPPPTYYQQLGLSPQASLEEIKTAYRNRVCQVDPDRLPAETPESLRQVAQREFLQLQRAYRVLSDSRQRQAYDLSLKSKPLPPCPPVSVAPVPELISPTPNWPTLLSAGLAGAALCLMGLAFWNSLSPTPSLDMTSKTGIVNAIRLRGASGVADPIDMPVDMPGSAETVLNSLALGEASVQEVTASPATTVTTTTAQSETPFQPSAEQIDRFARALVQVQPLLQATQNRLEQANSSEERQQIEQQFEKAASKVIAANQLTLEEYHRISAIAQSDSQVAASVTAAARRWMP